MKKPIFLLLLHLISCVSYGQLKQADKLNWLEGRWNRVDIKDPAQAFETWEFSSEKELKGLGAMLENSDTVFVERLTITRTKGSLYYIAEVAENAEPTYFKITDLGGNSFVCENEGHDFPKKIAYTLDNNLLTVVISGNSRSRSFIFKKED